jgi:hypothetical protein
MIKRSALSFTMREEDYTNFKLITHELISKRIFKSQLEIMECFTKFLMNATPEDLMKLKLASATTETNK